jgi:predicted AlkP superfamily phosphohydrolase/phosphomutase
MKTHHRVLVIGLDGVPLDIIQTWADAGHLPVLQKLMDSGAVGRLKSTMPPTSGPSWSSFATGKNPGKTGIYDFLHRRQGTYRFPPISTRHRHGKAIWALLSEAGKTVGVLNVPVSYPVEPVNGFMISGFMTPYSARDFVYPPGLLSEIKDEVGAYHIYPTTTFSQAHADDFFRACDQLLDLRTRTTLRLIAHYDWDFFITVFFDTDRILHQLWHYLDPTHPWRRDDADVDNSWPVQRYFQRLDESIGRILERVDDDTTVIVLSDHGMGPAHNFVVLNNWLAEVGLLYFKRDPVTWLKRQMFRAGLTLKNVHKLVDRLGLARHAEYKALYSVDGLLKRLFLSFLNVDWSRTRAYSFGRHTGPIYVNLKGREPRGIVEPGREYEAVRQEIAELAQGFRDPRTGRPIIGRVLRREELYNGPHFDQAPDLTLLPAQETDIFFGLADFGDNQVVGPVYRYSGMHRDDGLLIMHGKNIQPGTQIEGAVIWDVAPTILYTMGVEVPQDMDGQVLQAVFKNYDPSRLVFSDYGHSLGEKADTDAGYSPADEREIVERLKDLGYLG